MATLTQGVQSTLDTLKTNKTVKFNSDGVPVVLSDIGAINAALSDVLKVGNLGAAVVSSGYQNVVSSFFGGPKKDGGEIRGPGGPRDDIAGLYALSNSEHVTNAASAQVNRALLKWMDANPGKRVGAMADGGSVGEFVDTMRIGSPVATAVQALISEAHSITAGGNTSSGAAVAIGAQLAAARGWIGPEFDALNKLWTRESGWNPNAINPSSGAYGIPQSLGHGHPYNLGDVPAQVRWGDDYIAGRYGDPIAAWAHELQYGWYDGGGGLKPGLTLAYNGTGKTENVRTADQEDQLGEKLDRISRQLDGLTNTVGKSAVATGQVVGTVLNGRALTSHLDARTRTRP